MFITAFTDQLGTLFGAPGIAIADIHTLGKSAPDILVYALPAILIITLIEFVGSYLADRQNYEGKESMGSILVGAGNLGINLAMKTIMLYFGVWMYNILPYRIALNWWTLVPCFLIYDLCTYWTHRVSHFCPF